MSNERQAFLNSLSEAKASRLTERASIKRRMFEQTTSLPAEAPESVLEPSQFSNLDSYREAGGAATPGVVNYFDSLQTERLVGGQDRLSAAIARRTEGRSPAEAVADPLNKFSGTVLNMTGSALDMLAPDPVAGEENLLDRVDTRVGDVAVGTLGGLLDIADQTIGDSPEDSLRNQLKSAVGLYENRRAKDRVTDDAARAAEGRPSLAEERDANPVNRAGDAVSDFGRYLGSEGTSDQQELADADLGKAAEEGFMSAVGYAFNNPIDFASSVVPATAAFLVPAAVVGRTAGAAGRASGLSEAAATKLASTAGITSVGGISSVVNASDVSASIMDMPQEALEQSPVFTELVGRGLSPEQAQVEMAERGFSRTLGLTGISNTITLGLAQKFRANVLEDIAAGRTAAAGGNASLARGAIIGGSKEFGSEAAQEGGEAVASGAGEVGGGVRAPEDLLSSVPGAAAVGGLAGAGTGAPAGAAQQIGYNLEKGREAVADRQAKGKQAQEAVESGDVSALLDEESGIFSPVIALAALRKHVRTQAPTQAAVDAGEATVEALQKQQSTLEEELGVTADKVQEELDSLDARRGIIEERGLGKAASDALKVYERELNNLAGLARKVGEAQNFVQETSGQLVSDDPGSLVASADEAPSPTSREAVQSVVTLAMTTPESLDIDEVESLVSNESNGLLSEEREFLRSTVASQRATNEFKGLEGVRQDVIEGGPGFRGLEEYQASFRQAMRKKLPQQAANQLAKLRTFAESRAVKRDALTQAFDAVVGTQNEVSVRRNEDNSWTRVESITPEDRASGRGYTIRASSGNLIDSVSRETSVLELAVNAMESALAIPTQEAAPSPTPETPVQTREEASEELPPVDLYEDGAPEATDSAPVDVETAQEPLTEAAQEDEAVSQADAPAEPENAPEASVELSEGVSDTDAELRDIFQSLPDEDSDPEPEAAEPTPGRVSVFETETEPKPDWNAEDFFTVNHLTQFFRQDAGKDDEGATQRPLVVVGDFLNWLRTTGASLDQFLANPDLGEFESAAVNSFSRKAQEWSSKITALLPPELSEERQRFRYEDPLSFFRNEDGDLDENVKTAISYGAYTFVAENETLNWNDAEGINGILGRRTDTEVTSEEFGVLGNAGQSANLVYNELGRKVAQTLGLKPLDHAPEEMQGKFEAALGFMAVKLLEQEGILETTKVSTNTLERFRGNDSNRNEREYTSFVRMSMAPSSERNGRQGLSVQAMNSIREFKDVVGKSQGILPKLFGAEDGMKAPSLEPVPYTQKQVRGRQDVPQEMVEILEKEGQKPHVLREDMVDIWNKLASVRDRLAGVRSDDYAFHVANQKGGMAKDNDLLRQIDNMSLFIESLGVQDDGGYPEFYFDHVMWRPQRVGIDANLVNPLQSKVHRHLIASKDWRTETPTQEGTEALTHFRMSVAQGLGIDIDKQERATSLEQFSELMRDPVITQAIKLLQKARYEDATLSDLEQSRVAAAVEIGGEGFHSLDALMNMAHYQQAIDTGQTTYSSMTGEVDGVANGPMLALFSLGAADAATLERGGFFTQASGHENANVWAAAPGNRDLYQATAERLTRVLESLPRLDQESLEGIYAISGRLSLDGLVQKPARTTVKEASTPLIFGSSSQNAVNDMAVGFVETYYSKVEKLANEGGTQEEMDRLTRAVNQIVGRKLAIRKMPTIEEARTELLPQAVEQALKDRYTDTVGQALTEALGEAFAVFMETRDAMNNGVNMAFGLQKGLTEALERQVLENMPEGQVARTSPKDGQGVPLHGLTLAQKREVARQTEPTALFVTTPLSQGERGSGIYLPKSDVSFRQAPEFEIKAAVASAQTRSGASKTTVRTMAREDTAPGVSLNVLQTHSIDTAGSHRAIKGKGILQVHDAHIGSFIELVQIAKDLNESIFHTLLEYSAPMAAFDAIQRTVVGVAEQVDETNLPAIKKALGLKEGQTVSGLVQAAWGAAQGGTRDKLITMTQLGYVSQYAYEGGSYEVTDADRTRAEELLKAIPEQIPQAVADAARAIDEALELVDGVALVPEKGTSVPAEVEALDVVVQNGTEEQQQVAREAREDVLNNGTTVPTAVRATSPGRVGAQVREQVSTTRDAQARTESPHGELGLPLVMSDPDLVEFFEQNPERNARELNAFLRRRLEDGIDRLPPRVKLFRQEVLRTLSTILGKDMKVQYVTPQTPTDGIYEEGLTKARGWYSRKTVPGGRIYVKSPDFRHSGVTSEMLTHEMIHAALAQIVDDAQAVPSHRARKYVDELERLRSKANEIIDADPSLADFKMATVNVNELIAWGMTNVDFQRKVLNHPNLRIASKTRKAKLIEGMQRFIETLNDILFAGSTKAKKDLQYNGMRALIDNVAGLVQEQATGGPRTPSAGPTLAQNTPDPMTMNNEQVIDALGNLQGRVDPLHVRHLKRLMQNITEKVHGPYGADHARWAADPAVTRADRFMQALATGETEYVSETLNSKITLTEQEAFALEQVEASIAAALNNTFTAVETTAVNTQLRRIFLEAQKVLKPADFEQAFNVDAATAQQQYDFVFKVSSTEGGRTEALSRFAALGLTSVGFRKLLDFNTYQSPQNVKDLTWKERLGKVFSTLLDLFTGKLQTARDRDPARQQLTNLVDQLVRIETRRKTLLQRRDDSKMSKLEDSVSQVSDTVREKIEKGAKSKLFTDSKSGIIRAMGSVTSTLAGERMNALLDVTEKVRNSTMRRKQGALAELVTEARGPIAWVADALLRATRNEQQRKGIKDGTAQILREEFKEELSQDQKAAITDLLRADTAALLDANMSLTDIQQLLTDPQRLAAEIQQWEGQLSVMPNGRLYSRQAKDTAYHMATGLVRNPNLHLNAYTLARLFGEQVTQISEKDAKAAEAVLDPLITLRALDYMRKEGVKSLDVAAELMRVEGGRTTGQNGMEATLLLAKSLKAQSKERLFKDSEALMIKGYTPELYKEDVEILVATRDVGRKLELQGYKRIGSLVNDRADVNQVDRELYVREGMGLQSFNTGAVSYAAMEGRGSQASMQAGQLNAVTGTPYLSKSVINQRIGAAKAGQKRSVAPNYDPAKQPTQNHMVPVFNPAGEVVNYRYMMSRDLKDRVMKRDNDFDTVLGALNAGMFDKVTSQEQNQEVVGALLKQYQEDSAENPEAYLEVGPQSSDPALREYWFMLPGTMKKDVRKQWGQGRMYVRTDHINMIFGFRKYSLSEVWNKYSKAEAKAMRAAGIDPNAVERSIAEQLFASLAEGFFGNQAALRVRQGEDILQELVRETKDLLVVKTGTTLFFNIMSNVTQLLWLGVSPVAILRDSRTALLGVLDYRRHNTELLRLTSMKESGYVGNAQDLDQQIALLKDALARNPARDMIEAGLLPTIVEDVSLDEDEYSYKARLGNKVDRFTAKLPEAVRGAGRTLYMAHDTPAYKVLAQGTQLSDFVARYTLFQYETSRRKNPLSREEAIRSASDAFVNYDVPSGKGIQYLNDMGLLYFTKYYVRIQRTILRLWRENPARGLMLLTAGSYFDGIQTLLDSTAHVGNPLEPSALTLVEAMDELATVKVLMSPMD